MMESTPEQLRAETPAYKAEHPAAAALERNYNPFYGPQTFAYQAGAKVRDMAMRPNALGGVLNRGPLAGGLTGAAIGGLAGGAIGGIMGGKEKAKQMALIAALLGASVGSYSGHLRKQAFYRGDTYQQINQLLVKANISFDQRIQLMAAVPRLPQAKAEDLLRNAQRVGGAGIGALVARYLMGAGLLGTAFGGLLGGMVGGSLYFGPRNSFGNPSLGRRDFSGNNIVL